MNKKIKKGAYMFDDSIIYDKIDETLINLDISVLEKTREEAIRNNESTEILDKVINEKKRRMESVDLITESSNKKIKIDKSLDEKEYEPYNFEEEELEEDDYHYDDLD